MARGLSRAVAYSGSMAGFTALILAVFAGAFCYLASPRQQWVRAGTQPLAWLGAAGVCVLASSVLWCHEAGVVAGLCAMLGALAASLALMPFIGACARRGARRDVKPRDASGEQNETDTARTLTRGRPEVS